MELLTEGKQFDVIILSSQFNQEVVKEFIAQAKKTVSGSKCAFITIIKQSNDRNQAVASGMIDGTDGILMEPFSTTSLKQVAQIANRVRSEKQETRVQAGLNMMFQEIIPAVDRYAEIKRQGGDTRAIKKELTGLSENLKKVGKNYFKQMIDAAVDGFSQAKPRFLPGKVSSGDRMKALMEKKLEKAAKTKD